MIDWIAIAAMLGGLVSGWFKPFSRLSLALWLVALPLLIVADAWSVNIALTGFIVGFRTAAFITEAMA